jgi:hypothetical protein
VGLQTLKFGVTFVSCTSLNIGLGSKSKNEFLFTAGKERLWHTFAQEVASDGTGVYAYFNLKGPSGSKR